MDLDFNGRQVVVTGGAGALGAAVVRRLVQEGAICHVPAHGAPPSGPPVPGAGRVSYTAGVDLADETAVVAFYSGLTPLWASIHCAGGFSMSPVAQTSLAEFSKLMATNAVSAFLCAREAVKQMRAAGAGGGRIVNVAAQTALDPRLGAGMAAYAAGKAAVASMTAALAEEVARDGIWVNAVAPSIIDTEANRRAMPKADHSRWPKPEEIAEVIVFLASPSNLTARGGVVPVYGRT